MNRYQIYMTLVSGGGRMISQQFRLKPSRRYALLVLTNALLMLILLTGCDSPGKSATTPDTAPSKSQPTRTSSSSSQSQTTAVSSPPRTLLDAAYLWNPR